MTIPSGLARADLRSDASNVARRSQLGVVVQDPALELVQRRARLDPQLVDEHRAGLLERVEGFRLPAGAVQRDHQLRAQALSQRVLGNPALEGGNDLGMPAELELRLDLLLDDCQAKLVEPCGLPVCERLVAEVVQRLAPKELECLTELLRARRPAGGRGLRGEALEAADVQLVVIRKSQHVAGRAGSDALRAQTLPQRRDVPVERRPRGLRRPLAPESLDQLVAPDDLAVAQKQKGKE